MDSVGTLNPVVEIYLSAFSGVAPNTKNILVFRTNVDSNLAVQALCGILNLHLEILHWSIDIEDVDNVLRIEAAPRVTSYEVMALLKTQGLTCEPLEEYMQ